MRVHIIHDCNILFVKIRYQLFFVYSRNLCAVVLAGVFIGIVLIACFHVLRFACISGTFLFFYMQRFFLINITLFYQRKPDIFATYRQIKNFDNFFHCDIRLFLHKFQNILLLFFCKNWLSFSQLHSNLITTSAYAFLCKAVYGTFIYWKTFCHLFDIWVLYKASNTSFLASLCRILLSPMPYFITVVKRLHYLKVLL